MGTPGFALHTLCGLLMSNHRIAAVVTQPDKPQGRHARLMPPPVKDMALKNKLPVLQPETLRSQQFYEQLRAYSPDIIVVAAYGKLLPPEILTLAPFGCLNVHASLLPKYRGAAPIQHAILNGEKTTGITIMKMDEGLDTGDILLAGEIEIGPDETAGGLFERLGELGADLLCQALENLCRLTPVAQDDEKASWAPALTRRDAEISFFGSAKQAYDRFRAVTPRPGAHCMAGGRRLKILKARPAHLNGHPGQLLDAKRLIIGCESQSLELVEVQPEGSRPMTALSYINGRRLRIEDSIL
jgi:methionyl-tRNA formyltransferase